MKNFWKIGIWSGIFSLGMNGAFAATLYYHPDHLGSTSVVTDPDARAVELLSYTPFGETVIASPPAYGGGGEAISSYKGIATSPRQGGAPRDDNFYYTNQELDPESALYDCGARYYDPVVARFTSVDPVAGRSAQPQSFNPYAYVWNNPIRFTDPDGREPVLFEDLKSAYQGFQQARQEYREAMARLMEAWKDMDHFLETHAKPLMEEDVALQKTLNAVEVGERNLSAEAINQIRTRRVEISRKINDLLFNNPVQQRLQASISTLEETQTVARGRVQMALLRFFPAAAGPAKFFLGAAFAAMVAADIYSQWEDGNDQLVTEKSVEYAADYLLIRLHPLIGTVAVVVSSQTTKCVRDPECFGPYAQPRPEMVRPPLGDSKSAEN